MIKKNTYQPVLNRLSLEQYELKYVFKNYLKKQSTVVFSSILYLFQPKSIKKERKISFKKISKITKQILTVKPVTKSIKKSSLIL